MTGATGPPRGVRVPQGQVGRRSGRPVLLAGSCPADGFTAHPAPAQCPRCWGPLATVPLSALGSLYSYSVVRVGARAAAHPYTVGQVDLDEGARVFAIVESADDTALRPDLRVSLRLVADGEDYLATWVTEPAAASGHDSTPVGAGHA